MTGTIVALMVFGFALVFLEVFLPGGVAGALGAILLVVGIALCFRQYGSQVGLMVTIGSGILAVAIVVVGYKSLRKTSFGRSLVLDSGKSGIEPMETEQNVSVGEQGVAESYLRPSGIALFGKRRASVMTDGDFIEAGAKVTVVRIDSARLIVREINEQDTKPA